jgi:hypothetical protein
MRDFDDPRKQGHNPEAASGGKPGVKTRVESRYGGVQRARAPSPTYGHLSLVPGPVMPENVFDTFALHLDPVQRVAEATALGLTDPAAVHAAAARGTSGPATTLPHADAIQRSFGPDHDVSGIQAHVGGGAATAATAIGARAYATGNRVAFASAPDLHTAAHEAAHIVQQRGGVQLAGGVGQAGDPYEQHADAVADAVVAGRSAAELLTGGRSGGATDAVQRKPEPEVPSRGHDDPGNRNNACAVDGAHAPNAIEGIQLYLTVEDRLNGLATRTLNYSEMGPGIAGPYKLFAHTKDDLIVYYVAHHVERQQNEWVIGPASAALFASTVELYAGSAAQLLPGSARVPGSQADGADQVNDPDSVVKQEALGRAPWQVAADGLAGASDAVGDHTSGGGLLNFARNSRIRLANYVRPAQELAEQLAADVAAGRVDHLEARRQAVEGRNALLLDTRRRQSPAASYASKALKEDRGKSESEMTRKKVIDNLEDYRASEATRAVLDADSELWGRYAEAMSNGEDVLKDALRDLGQSPAVSRSIVQSAGKTNKAFTRIARWGGPVGLAIGSLGAADMVQDIRDQIEADNWHAAARELAGFAGGVVGGELGAMGAVWIASAIVPGSAGVVIVASIIGGAIGGHLGASGGERATDLIASGLAPGLVTPLVSAGGLAGAHDKDRARTIANQIKDVIFKADGDLAKLAATIPAASSRRELVALQRKRLEVLARRQQLEDLLTALRLGAFEGPDDCAAPPPAPAASQACDNSDNDCDSEVGW